MNFPPNKELCGPENYRERETLLRMNLTIHGLEAYLDRKTENNGEHLLNKLKAPYIIQSSITSHVRANAISIGGWDPNDNDPNTLFEAIYHAVCVHNDVEKLVDRLNELAPKLFKKSNGSTAMVKIRNEILYYKNRIETLNPVIRDRAGQKEYMDYENL